MINGTYQNGSKYSYDYGGNVTISGDLTVDGSVCLGKNSHTTVTGNCTIGRSDQTKEVQNTYGENSILEVKGDFTQTNKNDANYYVSYYGLQEHGDFNNRDGKTSFLFTGTDLQTISFADTENCYGNFDIRNPNVKFETDIYGWTLNHDTTLNYPVSLNILNKTNLNGFDLIINGVLISDDATVDEISKGLSKLSTLDAVTIYGSTGSVAETYAKENGLAFSTTVENQNVIDVLILKKYILGISSTVDTSLDLTNDGNINILDLIALKQKLFK